MTIHAPGRRIWTSLVVKREQATEVAKLRNADGPWKSARIYAFDLPTERKMRFDERTKKLRNVVEKQCKSTQKCPLRYIAQHKLTDARAFLEEFNAITACTGKYKKDGSCFGEGVVITDPASMYVKGRCKPKIRFKLKRREDSEAVVVGHNPGSLQVHFNQSKASKPVEFSLGIGLTETQRANLPHYFPKGSVVKFSFRSLGVNGVPKEARIIGRRYQEDIRDG